MSQPILTFFVKTHFIFLLLLSGSAPGQSPSAKRITKHINRLASDRMKGRGTGSTENAQAAAYLTRQFRKAGLEPLGTDRYYQPFTAKVRRVPVLDGLRPATNVIGFLD